MPTGQITRFALAMGHERARAGSERLTGAVVSADGELGGRRHRGVVLESGIGGGVGDDGPGLAATLLLGLCGCLGGVALRAATGLLQLAVGGGRSDDGPVAVADTRGGERTTHAVRRLLGAERVDQTAPAEGVVARPAAVGDRFFVMAEAVVHLVPR